MLLDLIKETSVNDVYSAVQNYFENRLRAEDRHPDSFFPSRQMILNSEELREHRERLGESFPIFVDDVIEQMVREELLVRYSDKFPNKPGSERFRDNFSYAGDLGILAELRMQAIYEGDY